MDPHRIETHEYPHDLARSIGLASDKRTSAKRARCYLTQGGSLPDDTEQ